MKKIWIGILVFGILAATGGIYYWFVASKKSQVPEVSVSVTAPTPEELATWDDPAGFQFQYPKSLKMDTHSEDNENYAHIEFTSASHPGFVIVWAKDTTAVDAASWVKAEKTFATAAVLDTTLGEKPGKKILIETPNKKIISAVIDEGVVFYIEGDLKDNEYWTNVHTTITSTFAFTYNKVQGAPQGAGEIEESVDEEEIVD